MFSQKKKKSKIWLFLIVIVVLFIAGICLNKGFDDTSGADNQDNTLSAPDNKKNSNEIPIFEYNNADDGRTDTGRGAESTDDSGNGNGSVTGKESSSAGISGDGSYDNDDRIDSDDYGYNESDNDIDAGANTGGDSFNDGYDDTKGKIWVISRGDTVVVQTYDDDGNMLYKLDTEIDLSMLPEYDRKAIKDGIYLNSEDELYEMLQDFEG